MARRRAQLAAAALNAPQVDNEVTGPTSALTSFLREQGITGSPGTYGRSRPQPQPVDPNAPVASTSANVTITATTTTSTTTTVSVSTTGSKRKKSGDSTETAKKKKKLQEEEFNIAGKKEGPKPGRYDNRTPGAIAVCGECGKKFTVSKYTASNPLGAGLLCSPCTSESIETIAAVKPKARAPKKRAVKALDEREYKPVKTLQQCCINVIGNNINNVDALGDIGPKNLDRISKIVAKHRALSGENLDLFLDAGHTELALYDCTNVNSEELGSIATFCPRLERLMLQMCGRLDDGSLQTWGRGLKSLKYLSLYAPFLVTVAAWKKYFEDQDEDHEFEGFGIMQSARFDDSCIEALVKHNPHLFNLQLSELGKLNDTSLTLLYSLRNLTSLDISRAGVNQGQVLTDDAVVALLENVGEHLIDLVLDDNILLTDRVLIEGVKVHCPRLRSLSLKSLSEVQSTGVQDLFSSWVNTGLTHVNFHRCLLIENEAIEAMLEHSGHSLRFVDLHSVDEIEDRVFYAIAEKCDQVEHLDVSFVRSIDNFVVKAFLDKMTALKILFVHGDNRVTDDCPQKRGVSIRGTENYRHVEL